MKSIEYTIIRKPHRKTVSIVILPDRSVEIRVPPGINEKEINTIAESKREWISKKLLELSRAEYAPSSHQYVNGETFLYMGKRYSLHLRQGRRSVELTDSSIQVTAPADYKNFFDKEVVKATLQTFFVARATEVLRQKTLEMGKFYNSQPVFVSVKDYKSRWGCCFSDGRIFYNWKIILAPEKIIDYVVAHELCHLLVPNHSKKYWTLVEKSIPNWQERRKWLKKNGHALDL